MKPVSPSIVVGTLLLALSTLSSQAVAEQETGSVIEAKQEKVESPVKAWLELQSSGKAASSQPQPLSGPVMDRVQERYLKNFSHPVPPYFEHVQPVGN
jgi:hypothetical protein